MSYIIMNSPLFENVSSEEKNTALKNYFIEKKVSKGKYIFFQGDKENLLYIIVSGIVKIQLDDARTGQIKTLTFLGAGQCFGEIAVVTGEVRSASALAYDTTVFLTITEKKFLELVKQHTVIALNLLKILCKRLVNTNEQLSDLAFRSVKARLADQLLALYKRFGSKKEDNLPTIDLKLTRIELSHLIAAQRETVSRAFNDFIRRKYIALKNGKIVLKNIKALEKEVK